MRFLQAVLILIAVTLLLPGCTSSGSAKPKGASWVGVGGPEIGKYSDGSRTGNYLSGGSVGTYAGASPNDPNGPLSRRTIYFVYDSSEVRPEYVEIVNNHANYLASNKSKSVVLEGHADERGSPEYNIALGEQRAKSVAKLMKLQGVSDSQIQVVSFGEEKPAVLGNDETAWQLNRRVEITYPDQ